MNREELLEEKLDACKGIGIEGLFILGTTIEIMMLLDIAESRGLLKRVVAVIFMARIKM